MGSPLGPLLANFFVCCTIKTANCPPIIDDMWMTSSPLCLIQHQLEFFLTPQPTATHQHTMEVERNAPRFSPFIGVQLNC